MMGMQAAARTKNLRIGTAVTLAAFYTPTPDRREEPALAPGLNRRRRQWASLPGLPTERVGDDTKV